MANESKIDWGALTAFTTTSLPSLADGDYWQSGEIAHSDPGAMILRIWYVIDLDAAPTNADTLIFRMAYSDGGSTPEIWDGEIGASEGSVVAAADVLDLEGGCARVHTHTWLTTMDVTLAGHFDVANPSSKWQLLVGAGGHDLEASGHTIRYQYGHPQYQA